jgi:hypothetical protein
MAKHEMKKVSAARSCVIAAMIIGVHLLGTDGANAQEFSIEEALAILDEKVGRENVGVLYFIDKRDGTLYVAKAEDLGGRPVRGTASMRASPVGILLDIAPVEKEQFRFVVLREIGSSDGTHCTTAGGATDCTNYTFPLSP